jgi:hypothetical protein
VEDVDASLVSLSDDHLLAMVDAAGRLPMVEWARMTAQQRRAMRASNLLTKRAVAAEKRTADAATRAANKAERDLIARVQQRAEQRRQEEIEPLMERNRQEAQYRGGI